MKKALLGICLVISLSLIVLAQWDTGEKVNKGIIPLSGQTIVSETATLIVSAGDHKRTDLILKHLNMTNNLYLGSSTAVTATTGYIIEGRTPISPNGAFIGSLYGIMDGSLGTGQAGTTVYYMEFLVR